MSLLRFRTSRFRLATPTLLLAAAFALAACEGDGTGTRTVASVTVTGSAQTVEVGKTVALSASALDSRGRVLSGKSFTWSSNAEAVATVAGDGTVTGRSAGPVTITATTDGKSGTFALTVTPVAPVAVASVVVAPDTATLVVGATRQLAATARDAAGNTLTGRAVTWSSADSAIARVSATGLVTAVRTGTARITATAEGRSGGANVTVVPVPVASVTVASDTTIAVGGTAQLTATARDAAGNVLTGRAVTWSSSSAGIARVDAATGVVTGVAAGTAVITADVEGRRNTATVTVVAQPVARIAVSPPFAMADVGATAAFSATAFNAGGGTVSSAAVTWSSSGAAATVSATGTATGAAEGQAWIVARSGVVADSALLAVLGAQSLLSTAFPGGAIRADVQAGQTFSVPVTLDLSRVSANGDLGSVQLEVRFDPAVLQYVSGTSGVQGAADVNLAGPGRVVFALAATTPQGSPRLTLVTLVFRVAPGALAGTERVIDLSYTARPSNGAFVAYAAPVTVDGRVRVVAP